MWRTSRIALSVRVAQFFGGRQSLHNVRRNIRRCLMQRLLRIGHLFERHPVEEARRQSKQHGDLLDHRHGLGFRLLEARADALPMIDDLASGFIEAGAELGECFQFLELRVGELEMSGNCAIRRHAAPLRPRAKRICRHRPPEEFPVRKA